MRWGSQQLNRVSIIVRFAFTRSVVYCCSLVCPSIEKQQLKIEAQNRKPKEEKSSIRANVCIYILFTLNSTELHQYFQLRRRYVFTVNSIKLSYEIRMRLLYNSIDQSLFD